MSLRTTLFASKARKRVTIGAIAGLIILVSVFFIDWIANQPVTSVINIPSSAYTSPKITYQKIDTAYFATKIPSIYQVTKTVDNYDQTNLNISAYSRSTKIEIAFVTDVLPSGGFADYLATSYALPTLPIMHPITTANYRPERWRFKPLPASQCIAFLLSTMAAMPPSRLATGRQPIY